MLWRTCYQFLRLCLPDGHGGELSASLFVHARLVPTLEARITPPAIAGVIKMCVFWQVDRDAGAVLFVRLVSTFAAPSGPVGNGIVKGMLRRDNRVALVTNLNKSPFTGPGIAVVSIGQVTILRHHDWDAPVSARSDKSAPA